MVFVVVDDFADDACGNEAGHAGKIDGRFGLSGANEHAAAAGAEGEDVSGTGEVVGRGIRVDGDLDGVGAVVGGDAGGDALAGLDGFSKRGAEAGGVLLGHGTEAEVVGALLGESEADEAASVAGHEVDGLGGDELGGEGEVTFVFAVFIVDDDDHASGTNLLEGSGNVGKGGRRHDSIVRKFSHCGEWVSHRSSEEAKKFFSLDLQASSSDGSAQYMENLRTLYLYDESASMKSGAYPGSQAGVADMFAYDQDQQDWYPAGYWLWNLRGQIAANLSSGNFSNNLPIFSMYLSDLPAIESWTSAQMGGKAGACVPETMRFNGNGYYNGGNNTQNASCAQASSPSYNALNIASGPEIALWIWQQYLDTGSLSFLQQYYPVMQQAATFLLAYQSVGSDGFLHAVANAHESQWAVPDPTDDIAADQALFPAVISAATLLNTDSSLVSQLRTAENQIEPYARVSQSNLSALLNSQPTSASAAASADAAGSDVIGDSYQPSATIRNSENIGLEPVWPYGVIGDSTTVNGDNLTALVDRTYNSKPNTDSNDWSFDAVDAARLDMGSQVSADLVDNTEKYQTYISGLAAFNPGSSDEPYIEQASNVATALDEALATDYDGTLRFAPAWPSGWNGSGTVYIQGGSKVDVQVESGTIATAAIQAGTTETMTVRNPWPGQQAEVVNGSSGAVVVGATTASTFSVPVTAGSSYLVEQPSSLTTSLPFAQVTGSQATTAKHLGSVSIGLNGNAPPPLRAVWRDSRGGSRHGAGGEL